MWQRIPQRVAARSDAPQQVGTWLSLVERTLGVGEVASSNLVVPTIYFLSSLSTVPSPARVPFAPGMLARDVPWPSPSDWSTWGRMNAEWDHNTHYHAFVLRCVPEGCGHALVPMKAPGETLADIRSAARDCLPGAIVRRRLFFRYTLTWRKPVREACSNASSNQAS